MFRFEKRAIRQPQKVRFVMQVPVVHKTVARGDDTEHPASVMVGDALRCLPEADFLQATTRRNSRQEHLQAFAVTASGFLRLGNSMDPSRASSEGQLCKCSTSDSIPHRIYYFCHVFMASPHERCRRKSTHRTSTQPPCEFWIFGILFPNIPKSFCLRMILI